MILKVIGIPPVLIIFLVFMVALFALPSQSLANDATDKIVVLAGCMGCHRISKEGSSLARPLLKLYSKFDKDTFLNQLKQPPVGMPNYNHLSYEMLESIFTYFLTPPPDNNKIKNNK